MIVCHCAGVSDSTIARYIDGGASSVDEIIHLTGAGRRCAPCREEIASLLSERLPMFRPSAEPGPSQVAASL
jgi:bacterioferritin-associated ferredoxin